jgi:hypothetical protein
MAEPLTDVGYPKSFGALTADIEIPAIELLIAGTFDSLTIPAVDSKRWADSCASVHRP